MVYFDGMVSQKDVKTVLFVVFCIALNLLGRLSADALQVPLWFDSVGTVLMAYVFGVASGAIVGVTTNVLYCWVNATSYVYGLTSIAIAAVVGITAQKKWFNSFFGTMTASLLVTLVSVVISVPLNWIFFCGMTGNVWGDGVIRFMHGRGMHIVVSSVLGQFYLDFLDKVVTLGILYLLIKLWRKRRLLLEKRQKHAAVFVLGAALLALGTNVRAQAQTPTDRFNAYVQTVYSSDTGLPCGEANDVVQTSDGILWIGTYAGLYRYNGSEFKWMNEYESVRSVNCLYVDEEGRLWIGTNDNGLSICINEKIVNTLDNTDGLPSNSVKAIVKGADGYYYVGTSVGILVLELNSGLRICNIIKEAGYTKDLSADKNGFVAAVSSGGDLYILNESEIRYAKSLGADREIFTSCSFGADGFLRVGTSRNRLLTYEITEEDARLVRTDSCGSLLNVNSIFFDGDKTFICADNGIVFFDAERVFRHINTGSFNNSIDNMAIDYQGNYWFTSSRQGILKLSNSSFINLYGSLGFAPRVVNAITEWNGALYVGTDDGLDIIRDGAQLDTPLTRQFAAVRIRCITKDAQDNLWLCTYGRGLVRVGKDGGTTFYDKKNTDGKVGNRMRVCITLKNGTVVAAGETGVSFIENGTVVRTISKEDGMTGAMILTLMERQDGAILAGSDGNGLVCIKNGAVERILTIQDGLTSDVILRTVREPNGPGVFVVTSNALCYMDEETVIRPLKKFPYFNNYDIQTGSDGQLFVLGSGGIHVVNKDDLLARGTALQYDVLDSKSGLNAALTANAWNYCDADGNLYLSCGTGIYIVNMHRYLPGHRSYRLMASKILVDGVPFALEQSEQFIISRDTVKIEFFPEVVNYSVSDPFVTYQLEGFDAQELMVPQSELTKVAYTNLPSGNYTFRLAVLDKDLHVLEQCRYELVKEKEIYDTSYFLGYLILIAFLAVAYLTWFITRRQIQRTLERQKQQLAFAQEQVRMGNETILAIAKTVDAKDENTSQHSMRVSEYSVLIARELGFTDAECENLRKAALLHDIGKIGIPDRILNKPARLDDDEYAIMKSHVTRGAEILKDFTMIDHVHEGTLYHHEKYDGTGYPSGLKGEEIPLYGRIIGVADAFDAMTANRVYRKQLDFDYVLNELKRCRGTQFDPHITDIMLKLIETGKIDVEALYKRAAQKGADA